MYDKSKFSNRIKAIRNDRGMTQKDFAEFTESTTSTISAYENGTKNPSLEIVSTIAQKCEVSLDWLCGLTDTKKKERKIETYADLLKIVHELLLINEKMPVDWFIFHEHLIEREELRFNDSYLKNALLDLYKVYNLYLGDTVDKEMYEMLIDTLIKKHSISIIDDNLPF